MDGVIALTGRARFVVLLGLLAFASALCTVCAASSQSLPRLKGPLQTIGGPAFEARVGTITDVGIDARRNVYVLDGLQGMVDVFREDASFVDGAALSSHGHVNGRAMAVTPTGRVFVLPANGHELIELEMHADTLRLTGSFPISVAGGDVCAGRRSVFVVGFDSLGLIHEYGFDGHPGRVFGGKLAGSAPGWLVADRGGHISCSDRAVALASEISPTVELYSEDGHLLWRSAVSAYRSVEIRPAPAYGQSGYSLHVPRSGADAVVGLVLFRRTVAAQVFRGRGGNVLPHAETLLFHAESDHGVTGRAVPWPSVRRIYGEWALVMSHPGHSPIEVYRVVGGRKE